MNTTLARLGDSFSQHGTPYVDVVYLDAQILIKYLLVCHLLPWNEHVKFFRQMLKSSSMNILAKQWENTKQSVPEDIASIY